MSLIEELAAEGASFSRSSLEVQAETLRIIAGSDVMPPVDRLEAMSFLGLVERARILGDSDERDAVDAAVAAWIKSLCVYLESVVSKLKGVDRGQ